MAFTCFRKYFKVSREDIGFLKFILEACDGIATVTTLDVDADGGVIEIRIPPLLEQEVAEVLGDLLKGMEVQKTPSGGGGL